jgi:tetratricopeptide (TPR) repeat protein
MRLAFVLSVLAITAAPLAAQQDRLGEASFPNSGAPAAQADFLRGLLLLHSFEYEEAATAFRAAQQTDPAFAMAYWGEAMTYTHPIWNQQDTTAALTALRRFGPTAEARASKTPTERERAWLGTVEILYSTGTKAHRDTLYEQAVEKLVARFPEDDEARLFESLALMGLSQGIRDVPTYERAGAIAMDQFKRHPNHPGAAHYVIHAFDDPAHANRALPAARAYSQIAPGAAHAQHMTTHIFLALGMWPEVVSQNIIASGPDTATWQSGHYTDWLGYGLLQQGDTAAAGRLLRSLRDHQTGGASPGRRGALMTMIDEFVVNSERWRDPALDWPVDERDVHWLARVSRRFVRGYAALRRGEIPAAQGARAELEVLADSVPAVLNGGLDRAQAGVMALELRALLAWQNRDTTETLANARRATAFDDSLPVEFGPPTVVKPSHELLGELLLAAGRPADAARSFEQALALAPGRRLSLRGLAEAKRLAGQ